MIMQRNFFDRFFHIIAAVVDLQALLQVFLAALFDKSWGFKEWLSVIIAVVVTVFMVLYGWIKNGPDENDNNKKPPGQQQSTIIFIGQYNHKCKITSQHLETISI